MTNGDGTFLTRFYDFISTDRIDYARLLDLKPNELLADRLIIIGSFAFCNGLHAICRVLFTRCVTAVISFVYLVNRLSSVKMIKFLV